MGENYVAAADAVFIIASPASFSLGHIFFSIFKGQMLDYAAETGICGCYF